LFINIERSAVQCSAVGWPEKEPEGGLEVGSRAVLKQVREREAHPVTRL
jgi:hypothetical protein